MNEYIITAEVKLIVNADDELLAKDEFESSLGWLTDHYTIKSVNKVGIDVNE